MKKQTSLEALAAAVVVTLLILMNAGPATAADRLSDNVAALDSGNYQVINSNSSYCLTVLANLTTNGSKVAQARCRAAPGQKWVYIAYDVARWNLYNPHSGKCLDTTRNRERAQMVIYSCSLPSSNSNQIFYILASPSGRYVTIKPNWNAAKCVGVAGGSLDAYVPVVFATCDNSSGQQWYRQAVS